MTTLERASEAGWQYYGEKIDYDSGEIWHDGQDLTVGNLGATLLASAGVDSRDYLPGMAPIQGVLK